MTTLSGMMLLRTPPLMVATVTIAGLAVRSVCRLTIVCRPSTICDATTIGSTPFHGIAPCVCRPWTTMRNVPPAAISAPGRYTTLPTV